MPDKIPLGIGDGKGLLHELNGQELGLNPSLTRSATNNDVIKHWETRKSTYSVGYFL